MKQAYENAFVDLVVSLIRKEVVEHFNYDPEKVLLLTQPDVIALLSDDYYFQVDNYIKK